VSPGQGRLHPPLLRQMCFGVATERGTSAAHTWRGIVLDPHSFAGNIFDLPQLLDVAACSDWKSGPWKAKTRFGNATVPPPSTSAPRKSIPLPDRDDIQRVEDLASADRSPAR